MFCGDQWQIDGNFWESHSRLKGLHVFLPMHGPVCIQAYHPEMSVHIGAGNEVDATSSRSFKPEAPTILVVGNEGRGLRSVVRRACKDVLRIDSVAATADQFSPVGVESLNVSVAAGILLHQMLHAQ